MPYYDSHREPLRPSFLGNIQRFQIMNSQASLHNFMPAAPPPPTPLSVYHTSAWSSWVLKNGVRYHYRWGWNSAIPTFARSDDAVFEIANQTATRWRGNARALNCANGTLGPNQDVNLAPDQQAMISFNTDNCGTLAQPHFEGSVVRSSSY